MARNSYSARTAEEALRWIPVEGDSMWPSLRAGDVAGVEPLVHAPRPGEVVLARFPHALVLHRVRWCDERTCALRGDNSPQEDPLLPASRILGRVRQVRRRGVVLAEGWDQGPVRLGRWRVAIKRGLASLLSWRRVSPSPTRVEFAAGSVPRRCAGAEGQRFGADFVVIDPAGRMLRGLNETAARVWELSDGVRTARAVAEHLAEEYRMDVGPVLADTLRFLTLLVGHGLMEELRADAEPARKEVR
jgi:signal peptidase